MASVNLELAVECARKAAHINGISDPYGARITDYIINGSVDREGLSNADKEAENNNNAAWMEVVMAVLAVVK